MENGNIPAEAGNETTKTPETGNESKTFTQEEVNKIIGERLAKEKSRYADYDDIKAKAAKYDKQEEANMSELEKAQKTANKYKQELESYKKSEKLHEVRSKVSKETGVPEDMLYGETEEECKLQAEKILKFSKPQAYPEVSDGGESKGHGKKSDAQLFGDFLEKQF